MKIKNPFTQIAEIRAALAEVLDVLALIDSLLVRLTKEAKHKEKEEEEPWFFSADIDE